VEKLTWPGAKGDGGMVRPRYLDIVVFCRLVSPAEFLILYVLLSHADSKDDPNRFRRAFGNAFPSYATIAKQLGISREIVKRHVRSLERKGFIRRHLMREVRKGRKTNTLYQFLLPEGVKEGPWAGPVWWGNSMDRELAAPGEGSP